MSKARRIEAVVRVLRVLHESSEPLSLYPLSIACHMRMGRVIPAVDLLVAEGLVERNQLESGRTFYSIHDAAEDEP